MSKVTLTFDNGPDPATTPRVLDILARREILTSFFCVGQRLEVPGALGVVRRAAAAGHRIGNHTYTHTIPLGLRPSPALVEEEIVRTQELLAECASDPKLFRPSGDRGHLDQRLLTRECVDYLVDHRFSCVLWHSVPGDLQGLDWVSRGLAAVAERDWTMMVLHDITGGALERLDEFLDLLADNNVGIEQEWPPDCVPIRVGTIVGDIERFVAPPSGSGG